MIERASFRFEPAGDCEDISSCSLLYPNLGPAMPANFVVTGHALDVMPDIAAWLEDKLAEIESTFDDVSVEHSSTNVRGSWRYAIISYTWAAGEQRLAQKQMQIFVEGDPPRSYTLSGTSLADVFDEAEPLFDQMVRSFEPA